MNFYYFSHCTLHIYLSNTEAQPTRGDPFPYLKFDVCRCTTRKGPAGSIFAKLHCNRITALCCMWFEIQAFKVRIRCTTQHIRRVKRKEERKKKSSSTAPYPASNVISQRECFFFAIRDRLVQRGADALLY